MRKLITIILLLWAGIAQAQTYQLNYDSIRVGKTAGTGSTSMYGKVYLKNVSLGLTSDSMLVVRNGRIFKVLKTNGTVTNVSGTSPISVATGTTTPVISMTAASAVNEGYVTTGTQTIAGNKTITYGSSGSTLSVQHTGGSRAMEILTNANGIDALTVTNQGTGKIVNFNKAGAVTVFSVDNNGTIATKGRITVENLAEGAGGTDSVVVHTFLSQELKRVGTTGTGVAVFGTSPTFTGNVFLNDSGDQYIRSNATSTGRKGLFLANNVNTEMKLYVGGSSAIGSFTESPLLMVFGTAIGGGGGSGDQFLFHSTGLGNLFSIDAPGNLVKSNLPFTSLGSISSTPQGTLYGTATGSITSAQLATSLTNETGTESAVFSTSPTLVTPVLGNATGGTLGLSGALTGITASFVLASGVNGAVISMSRSAGSYTWSMGIDAGTSSFNFYNNGGSSVANVNPTTGAYTATSDSRYKENITASLSALPLIKNIKIVQYDWKGSTLKEPFGVTAQQLYTVAPTYASKPEKEADKWGVAKAEMVPMLIKGIQELNEKLELALKRIEILEAKP